MSMYPHNFSCLSRRTSQLTGKLVPLTYRSIIRLSGPDTRKFLQGIASNDFIRNRDPSFYAVFMNPKGRLFSDAFVHFDEKDAVFLDVPTSHMKNVFKMLSMSMFGRKVDLSIPETMKVYGTIGKPEDGVACFSDSRYQTGHVFRSYLETVPSSAPQLTSLFKSYELLHGIWSADDGLKNQVAAHLNLDRLNAVSTTKGCYVGQETYTGYMHHHPHPARVVPVLLTSHSHDAMTSLHVEQVCDKLPATHVLQSIDGVQTGSTVTETVAGSSRTVGTLLYVQPKYNVGLVLCDAFEGVKGPWSIDAMHCLPISCCVC